MKKEKKRDRLLNYLEALGIKVLKVHYSGSGDSGQTDDITTEPEKLCDILDERFEDTNKPLKEVIDEFAWDAVERNEGGFYNNDGGYGEIIFDVKERTITMAHNNYITETQYEEYDL